MKIIYTAPHPRGEKNKGGKLRFEKEEKAKKHKRVRNHWGPRRGSSKAAKKEKAELPKTKKERRKDKKKATPKVAGPVRKKKGYKEYLGQAPGNTTEEGQRYRGTPPHVHIQGREAGEKSRMEKGKTREKKAPPERGVDRGPKGDRKRRGGRYGELGKVPLGGRVITRQ